MAKKKETAPEVLGVEELSNTGGQDASTETVETTAAEEQPEIVEGAPEEGKKETEAPEEGKKETEAPEEKVEKAKKPKKEAEALPDVVARFFQNRSAERRVGKECRL